MTIISSLRWNRACGCWVLYYQTGGSNVRTSTQPLWRGWLPYIFNLQCQDGWTKSFKGKAYVVQLSYYLSLPLCFHFYNAHPEHLISLQCLMSDYCVFQALHRTQPRETDKCHPGQEKQAASFKRCLSLPLPMTRLLPWTLTYRSVRAVYPETSMQPPLFSIFYFKSCICNHIIVLLSIK